MSGAGPNGRLQLHWRPFRFALPRQLVTAHGALEEKRGWLLRLETEGGRCGWGEAAALRWQRAVRSDSPPAPSGQAGRGSLAEAPASPAAGSDASGAAWLLADQASPASLPVDLAAEPIAAAIAALGCCCARQELEARLPHLPAPLAFALGLALAELDGLGSGADPWLPAPASALLLPAGEAMQAALDAILAGESQSGRAEPSAAVRAPVAPDNGEAGAGGQQQGRRLSREPRSRRALASSPAAARGRPPVHAAAGSGRRGATPLTLKWKVAAAGDRRERELLEWLLRRLPAGARLRLDANGGWDRATAAAWATRLAAEPRLDWLEQPLAADDGAGLLALARRVPVALDESLRRPDGSMRRDLRDAPGWPLAVVGWPGWLVRRPALDGDPRPLLAELRSGRPRLMLSTALETGIGMRLLEHLAALQQRGPTPTAPGLAPGWRPAGGLFAADPWVVWQAAGAGP